MSGRSLCVRRYPVFIYFSKSLEPPFRLQTFPSTFKGPFSTATPGLRCEVGGGFRIKTRVPESRVTYSGRV